MSDELVVEVEEEIPDQITIRCLLGGQSLSYPRDYIAVRAAKLAELYPEFKGPVVASYSVMAYAPKLADDIFGIVHQVAPPSLLDALAAISKARRKTGRLCTNGRLERIIAETIDEARGLAVSQKWGETSIDLHGLFMALLKGDPKRIQLIDAELLKFAPAAHDQICMTLLEVIERGIASFRGRAN